MLKRTQLFFILVIDMLSICGAWVAYYLIRVRSGWMDIKVEPDLLAPMIFIYIFWLVMFAMVGLYRPWYASSRFDELALVFKTTTIGCLFLFFAIFVDDQGKNVGTSSRMLITFYWLILLVATGTGRLLVRSIQRRMLIAGIGVQNTVIVGSITRARELFDEIVKYPALGYKVIGFAGLDKRKAQPYKDIALLGSIDDLPGILNGHEIKQVLIALDSSEHDKLLEIIAKCSPHKVGMKIIPDLYDIISGQARTNQIYGFPLIEISPQLMTPWEETVKRMLDVCVSVVVILVGLPLWLLVAVAVKMESSGPAIYRQERVGKDGELFNILKFRSMREDAEKAGPQWAGKQDPRVTRFGKILRKLHIDEIPQLWNVLRGHMSLVGPRPERPIFVEQLSREIPLYPRRLKVRPGITGWAQVKHKYDETIEDVKKKVQYDLFYIENMSLRMDFKILLSTAYHMLLGKGH